MRRLYPIAALALAAAASACAPNPIVARDPVPAPGPADAYVCASKPLPLNAFTTDCRPVPAAPQVVLRARADFSGGEWRSRAGQAAPVRLHSQPKAGTAGTVTEPRVTHRSLIAAAGLLALAAGQGASAQPAAYPGYQPRHYVYTGPDAPTVLQTEGCCQVLVPPGRPDLAAPPIPVAEVMNGGGFGYTGFDYFNDQITEGRLGARRRPKEYVIAPAYIDPPRY